MKKSTLQKTLKDIVLHQWKHGIRRQSHKSALRWLPVIQIKKDVWYGLSEDGDWVAGSEDKNVRIVELSMSEPTAPLLPCLEHSRSEMETLVILGLKSLGLLETVAHTFPFDAAVHCGLESGSDYWMELSLEWLQSMPIDNTIAKILSRVVKSKGISQKNRHRAFKLLKEGRKMPDLKHIGKSVK